MRRKYSKEKVREFLWFGIVGGVGTVINTGILYFLTIYANLYYLVASIFATEVAILSNFFGNNILTYGGE